MAMEIWGMSYEYESTFIIGEVDAATKGLLAAFARADLEIAWRDGSEIGLWLDPHRERKWREDATVVIKPDGVYIASHIGPLEPALRIVVETFFDNRGTAVHLQEL